MFVQLIEEFTAALCWARTARAYIAVTHPRPRARLPVTELFSCSGH
ncbi:MAG: hypothetical protein IIB67_04230 [Proteobacteria bacterium]|nr:hypothetical protein [Pseudomonadota bacterium]